MKGNTELVMHDDDPLKTLISEVRDRRFAVFPVLILGTKETSIPDPFSDKLAADLSGLKATVWRNGRLRPQKKYINAYDSMVSEVTINSVDIFQIRNSETDRSSQEVFNQIFFDLKHHPGIFDRAMMSRLFVKTQEFRRIASQQSYILVGRKGSGKSTLADFVTHGPTNKWKQPILYNIDGLLLEFLFTVCASAHHESDQRHVLPRATLMRFAWEALIHYACFHILRKEFQRGTLVPEQHDRFSKIALATFGNSGQAAHEVDEQLGDEFAGAEMSPYYSFFTGALTRALEFMESVINKAPVSGPDAFSAYIVDNLTSERFLAHTFGRKDLALFYDIVRHCRRNFLVALDGFDSNFQKFRQETLQKYRGTKFYDDRMKFEQDWLSGLVSAVRRLKLPRGSNSMSGRVDFCVMIPKDRFLEFIEYDRDAFEWEGKQVDISWTGIELSILLRKRLEVHKVYRTPKTERPLSRLALLLRDKFDAIPERIQIRLENTTVDVDIFQYLLRHSFWRPRDILFLAGRIFGVADYYQKHGMKVEPDTIKLVVAQNLHAIIEHEFVGELSGTILNIEGIIRRFEGLPQVMSFSVFFEIVRGEKLELPQSRELDIPIDGGNSDHERILRFLYNVGFIGFYINGKSSVNQQFLTKWIFVFNEGDTILRMLSLQNRLEMQIVIHPIFIEYLGLKPYRDALVCEFTNEYLVKQEAHWLAR